MNEWEIDNLPNRLTIMRVLLIPIIIGCLYVDLLPWSWLDPWRTTAGWLATWIFALASITDFFDGYIARKRNIVTVFGSFLDPVADKFLVVSSLLMLQALGRIPVIIIIILVLREFYITSLRLLAGEKGLTVPVGSMGKWKTAVQMIGMPMLMANDTPWGIPLPTIGIILIYTASVLSLYSAMDYTWALFKKMAILRKEKKIKKLASKQGDVSKEQA